MPLTSNGKINRKLLKEQINAEEGEMKWETLLQILKDLHPDVDFETCDTWLIPYTGSLI